MRTWPLTFVFLFVASQAQADIKRFLDASNGLKSHFTAWSLIVFGTDELKLTPDQADELFLSRQEHFPLVFDLPFALNDLRREEQRFNERYTGYFKTIYETLDRRQTDRFEQLMLQLCMDRTVVAQVEQTLIPAIHVYVGEVPSLDNKISRLKRRVDKAVMELEKSESYKAAAWREQIQSKCTTTWNLHHDWFVKQFGEYETQRLLGEPCSWRMYYNWGRHGYGPWHGHWNQHWPFGELEKDEYYRHYAWPVDVPDDWTLSDAEQNLQERRAEHEALILRFGECREEFFELVRRYRRHSDARRKPDADVDAERIRKISEELTSTYPQLWLNLTKARRYVEELGGDPFAEYKAMLKAKAHFTSVIRFHTRRLDRYLSLSDETMTKVDAAFATHVPRVRRSDETGRMLDGGFATNDALVRDIYGLLDPTQQRRFKQLVFRSLWFSMSCDQAFSKLKSNVELSAEQFAKLQTLKQRLAEVKLDDEVSHAANFSLWPSSRWAHWSDCVEFDVRVAMEQLYRRPFIQLYDDYVTALTEIVGADRVDDFLGPDDTIQSLKPIETPASGVE